MCSLSYALEFDRKIKCIKMENEIFTSCSVVTFCIFHADTKKLMILAEKDAQMLYLQSCSVW